ncbi:B12-binding domain-containing radical SAM protein, partial [Patescibacteria group bacterium]|nr:B12-binding domain-containing radical SAM protein [Patescibacteria group bacterium]
KILLINISLRPDSKAIFFPIGLGYIATAMKKSGIKFDLLDIEAHRYSNEEIEQFIEKNKYHIYCLGTIVTGYSKIKWITKKIREKNKNAIIICGNTVVSSVPQITLNKTEVDIGILGEGDITIVELINAICNNKELLDVKGICYKDKDQITFTEKRPIIENLDSLPIIDWEIFDVNIYLRESVYGVAKPYPIPKEQIKEFVVNTARGCPFQCTFCYHAFRGVKYRYRSADHIIKELKVLNKKYSVNYVDFFDELTFFSKKQVEEFVDKLIESGIKIFWNADIRGNLFNKDDFKLLKKVKNSGCLGMGYSLESGNKEILKAMNKHLEIDDFIKQKKALDSAGISTFTSIVLGYPQETKETINETFKVLEEAQVYPSAGYLLPQPGTPMYDFAIKEGLIVNEEEYLLNMGDRQDFRINLTSMDLQEFQKEVKRQLELLSNKLNLNLKKENLIKTKTPLQSS